MSSKGTQATDDSRELWASRVKRNVVQVAGIKENVRRVIKIVRYLESVFGRRGNACEREVYKNRSPQIREGKAGVIEGINMEMKAMRTKNMGLNNV